ncbi:MAG: hypothetical protein JWO68_2676 [Actinomycetia bacterium]|nr:hypothetical protein [Actinomycetes bacterium]
MALAVVAGCSSDSGGPQVIRSTTTTTSLTAGLPAPLVDFLDGVAAPGSLAFRASYQVLQKLGGKQTDVEVVSDPPSWQVRVGDLIVVDGPDPATCRTSTKRCVGQVREQLLAPTGVFSRFFASGTAQALATDARRVAAGDPVLSARTVAGVALRCAGIPLGTSTVSTYCLTAEGVFGWVDTPSVHVELTAYRPGPPGESTGVPYAIVKGTQP